MLKLTIRGAVGVKGDNNAEDAMIVLELMRVRRGEPWYHAKIGNLVVPLATDAQLIDKLGAAIKTFQKETQGPKTADGSVSPNGDTILFLGGVRTKGKQIFVDLDEQFLYAYEGSTRIFKFDCASGDSDHETADRPLLFKVIRKEAVYRSRKYDAQMNHALFFSDDGKAIHQSNAVGITSVLKSLGANYFGSHGCVRLSEDDATKLFSWADMLTPVLVDRSRKTFQ